MAEEKEMAEDWWKDATVRARKVEGGYESILELAVNFISFDDTAEMLEKELGRKPTPEEVDERSREIASDPMIALKALPTLPRPGEERIGEILSNWNRVRAHILGSFEELERRRAITKKEREKEGSIKD